MHGNHAKPLLDGCIPCIQFTERKWPCRPLVISGGKVFRGEAHIDAAVARDRETTTDAAASNPVKRIIARVRERTIDVIDIGVRLAMPSVASALGRLTHATQRAEWFLKCRLKRSGEESRVCAIRKRCQFSGENPTEWRTVAAIGRSRIKQQHLKTSGGEQLRRQASRRSGADHHGIIVR